MATEQNNSKKEVQPVYFKSLTIENVKCFKGKHTIDLSDGEGKPAQWTVILGNNNTGKTTLLKCLAALEPKEVTITLGPEGSALIELESGKKPVIRPKVSGPTFLFSDLGDDFFFSSFEARRYSLNAKLLLCSKVSRKLPAGQFSDVITSTGKNTFGYRFDAQTNHADFMMGDPLLINSMALFSYGASRKMDSRPPADKNQAKLHSSLFLNEPIENMEDWLLNLFVAENLGQSEAKKMRDLALHVLTSGLLPDVYNVKLSSREKDSVFENFAEFRTDYGWIRLRDLGYGYQTMLAWVLDLVKRMIERYPNSENPLAEPAVVLVDEIDLHLHPEWQRRIIAHLTDHFPNTQFIATAHSPLVVQSADRINLVILRKEGDHVNIEQHDIQSFKGWTVEEILTDLMLLDGQTMSQTYLALIRQFDEALDEDNFEKAKDAYDQLDAILHPTSSQRKLLKIQMTSLSPVEEPV